MVELIKTLLQSSSFLLSLEKINVNYSNVKQESVIRNLILELLNAEYLLSTQKAFAEYPRNGGQRVDLSIYDQISMTWFCIELKFQFTKDYGQFRNYLPLIRNDFEREVRKGLPCDLFILIVCNFDKADKRNYDTKWGFSDEERSLAMYLSKTELWQTNLITVFNNFNTIANHFIIPLKVDKPYTTYYTLHLLNRNVIGSTQLKPI